MDPVDIPIGGARDPAILQGNEPWGGLGAKIYDQSEVGDFAREHAFSNVGGFS